MAAVTFCDVVVSHQPFTYGLLFHELVHVEQYRQLGIPRFAELYVRGFLSGGWYDGLRFWTNQKTDAISKRIDLSGIEIDHQRSMNRTVCTSFEKGDGAIYILSRPSNEHPPGSGFEQVDVSLLQFILAAARLVAPQIRPLHNERINGSRRRCHHLLNQSSLPAMNAEARRI